jgi:hypothetical protein
VLAEWDGAASEPAARMGLDWETALEAFELEPGRTPGSPREALQPMTPLRSSAGGTEVRLVGPAADGFLDITRLEVAGRIPVDDGRFYVGVVIEGSGSLEYPGGSQRLGRGDAFVCPATLAHELSADAGRLGVIRCMEPGEPAR